MPIDEIDKQFLLLFIKGSTSSYGIWNIISKNPDLNIKPMAYNNINKRIVALYNKGYLEEIDLQDKFNIHGRKDYRVTIEGIEQVIPHILNLKKGNVFTEIRTITEYLDKAGYSKYNKVDIGREIYKRLQVDIISLTEYLGHAFNIWLSFDIRPMEADEKKHYHSANEYMKLQNMYQKLVTTDEDRAARRKMKTADRDKAEQKLLKEADEILNSTEAKKSVKVNPRESSLTTS